MLSFCCNFSVKLLRPGLCTAWVPSKWVPERSSQLLRHNHTLSTPRRVSNILQRGTATKPSCGQLVPDQIFTLRSRVRRKAAPLHRCSRKNHFKERAHERNWLFLEKKNAVLCVFDVVKLPLGLSFGFNSIEQFDNTYIKIKDLV